MIDSLPYMQRINKWRIRYVQVDLTLFDTNPQLLNCYLINSGWRMFYLGYKHFQP